MTTTYFHDSRARATKELAPGVQARSFWGDRMTLVLAALEPYSVVAPHGHPHEQVGTVISGEIEFTIGDETRLLRPSDVYVIPSDVPHSAKVGPAPVALVEVFSPVRETLKY
jgi:quercetin dioxygenase-like cupin family protein